MTGPPVVVKVGGSLLSCQELPRRLRSFLEGKQGCGPPLLGRCVLIAGGGGAADLIRAMDRIHGLGEVASHWLAVDAMELTAAILAAIVPGSRVVSTIEQIEEARQHLQIPVFAPRAFLKQIDAQSSDLLPASWDVTSDSIAARVGRHLGSTRLILLKSARLDGIATIADAVRVGLVDPFFPIAVSWMDRIEAVCMRDPEPRLYDLLR